MQKSRKNFAVNTHLRTGLCVGIDFHLSWVARYPEVRWLDHMRGVCLGLPKKKKKLSFSKVIVSI